MFFGYNYQGGISIKYFKNISFDKFIQLNQFEFEGGRKYKYKPYKGWGKGVASYTFVCYLPFSKSSGTSSHQKTI